MRKMLQRIFSKPNLLIALTAIFVVLTIGIDHELKAWAAGLTAPLELLCFRFFPVLNPGVFGGYLSDLDPWIIRIFFSVLFGFLALGIALGLYFISHKNTPILKVGLVIYVAGVFGNVWDRILTGTVVDYLSFRVPRLSGMAFNFADFVVFAGAVLIAISIFREGDELWFSKNMRLGYWVSPTFQRGFAFSLVLLGFAHFLVIALYSFVFLKVYVGMGEVSQDRVIQNYLVGLSVIEGAALILTFAGSVLFSHRLVGPLIAFGQFVERRRTRTAISPTPTFRMRRSDYFRDVLEAIAKDLDRD